MKKLTTEVVPNAGALVLLVSLAGMVHALSVGQHVGSWAGCGMTLGIVLMAWGTFNGFGTQEDPGKGLRTAVARIRSARHL